MAEETSTNIAPQNNDNIQYCNNYDKILEHNNGDHKKAMFEYCFYHNIFYNQEVLDQFISKHDDDIYAKMPQIYIDTINADFRFKDLTFFSQLKQDNFEKIYKDELLTVSLSEDDKKCRQQVIATFGYDPFKDDSIEDRPQLYRDLAGMVNESMRKNIAAQKAALNIVRSYQNIERYQKKITALTLSGQVDEETQEQLNQYMKVIANIQQSVNATSKDHGFATKNVNNSGRGMLSDVLNQVEGKGIDSGITNFYDIATSRSIREIADISNKSLLTQVNLSKTDYADILGAQCEIVRESQRKAKEAIEALRLVKEKIVKQELLDELEKEYREKGISEEDIEEFIHREYDLKDGKD